MFVAFKVAVGNFCKRASKLTLAEAWDSFRKGEERRGQYIVFFYSYRFLNEASNVSRDISWYHHHKKKAKTYEVHSITLCEKSYFCVKFLSFSTSVEEFLHIQVLWVIMMKSSSAAKKLSEKQDKWTSLLHLLDESITKVI